jgi:hypothetical protein
VTELVLGARSGFRYSASYARALGPWKLFLLLAVAALTMTGAEARGIMAEALADAYLQVSVFVAATLGVIYTIEARTKTDLAVVLDRYHRWQVPAAAVLGALPGCGGAVVVVTQYVRGTLSFGSVVAVLTATMGDAAFLLIAAEPMTGLAVFALGAVVGTVSGYIIDWTHGTGFMRLDRPDVSDTLAKADAPRVNPQRPFWLLLFVPGLILGTLDLMMVDTDALFGPLAVHEPTLVLGVAGALLAFAMWTLDPAQKFDPGVARAGGAFVRAVDTTNFVTVWVIVGFLIYELGVHFTGVDLAVVFDTWAPLIPLLAVLVGFLPGCGPQIVVTTLYISGAMPLSGQLGNAISNDGDALFPAIAMAPRAAVVATLYSAVPAVLVAYGYFLMFE